MKAYFWKRLPISQINNSSEIIFDTLLEQIIRIKKLIKIVGSWMKDDWLLNYSFPFLSAPLYLGKWKKTTFREPFSFLSISTIFNWSAVIVDGFTFDIDLRRIKLMKLLWIEIEIEIEIKIEFIGNIWSKFWWKRQNRSRLHNVAGPKRFSKCNERCQCVHRSWTLSEAELSLTSICKPVH